MASNVPVKDIMSKDFRVVRNDTSVQEVIATMTKFDLDYIMVVQSGRPTGIITEHDILVRLVSQGLAPSAVIARMIYTNPIQTLDENATVEDAVKLMKHWRIKHVPITKDEKLVGVVTANDIIFKIPTIISLLEELCHPR